MVNALRVVGVSLILLGSLFAVASIGDAIDASSWEAVLVEGVVGIILLLVGVVCLYLSYRRTVSVKPTPTTIIKEREVIKEIVMIPCRYCNGLMPQTGTFCPNCGARRQ